MCSDDLLAPLDRSWASALAGNVQALPADAPLDAHARIAAHPQFARTVLPPLDA